MTGNVLPIIATILEKTALGAHDSEIVELIETVREASPSASIGHDIERLHLHLNAVAQVIRESRVTERGLNLLNETTHDLASTLALQDLLRTIVSRARSLVGANVAYLTRLNEDHSIMRTVAAEGLISPATWELSANIGVGAVSLIVSSMSFFDTQDYLGDQRFRHTDSFDRAFKAESIVSLAGFPILSEDKLQGILFIADRYHRKLSGREISVLGSFALHAGVAMRNAHAFTMLSEALAEAERNRVALIDYIHRVDVSAAAHDEMTSLLAKGTEWPLFIQGMADQINGAIILYDEAFSVRERFASTAYRGQLALHGGAGRGESLVICHVGELDPIDIRNLERSTVALSIAKLWSEKRETEQLIASSTLLRHLILVNPPDASTISAIRDRLKITTDQPVMLALIALSGLDRAEQTTMIREAAAKTNLLVDLVNDTYLAVGPEKSIRAR